MHGLDSLANYLRDAAEYSSEGRAERIRCSTLVAWAEGDPIASSSEELYAAR
jgi:hypothetical protein